MAGRTRNGRRRRLASVLAALLEPLVGAASAGLRLLGDVPVGGHTHGPVALGEVERETLLRHLEDDVRDPLRHVSFEEHRRAVGAGNADHARATSARYISACCSGERASRKPPPTSFEAPARRPLHSPTMPARSMPY
ncbi:hypothetical protein ACFPRL_26980 [Pseudoclavibacter helvolus]